MNRRVLTFVMVALLGTATAFRLMRLGSVPGISGDEGWWGMQAIAWVSGQPYEARTTSGNPIDLFFLIPVALVHLVAAPSFVLLRVVPAFVNLVALPLGFFFVRRLYGSTTAWIHTVGLAILPAAIAHSRICQDPSQTIFWTGILIYVSLLGVKDHGRAWIYFGVALAIFPVVLWTHPTNVFTAPFLALPLFAAIRPLLPASHAGRAVLAVAAVFGAMLLLAIAWTAFRHLPLSAQYLDQPWLSMAAARLTDGAQWFEFAANNARLFNGVTIYHYFSGARPATVPYDAGFVVVVLLLLSGFLLTPEGRRSPLDPGLIAACVLMWTGFYAFAGPDALRPHFERWGLCLIVPAILVLARGLTAWIEWRPHVRWITISAATLLSAAVLLSFYVNYYREFATTGGRSHLTYVTAPIEPKQQAFEHILARNPGSSQVTVVVRQWWLFRPIAYLAKQHPHMSVNMTLAVEEEPAFEDALKNGRVFFVEFAGTPELSAAIDWIRGRGLRSERTTIRDASGRDLLEILQVTPR